MPDQPYPQPVPTPPSQSPPWATFYQSSPLENLRREYATPYPAPQSMAMPQYPDPWVAYSAPMDWNRWFNPQRVEMPGYPPYQAGPPAPTWPASLLGPQYSREPWWMRMQRVPSTPYPMPQAGPTPYPWPSPWVVNSR